MIIRLCLLLGLCLITITVNRVRAEHPVKETGIVSGEAKRTIEVAGHKRTYHIYVPSSVARADHLIPVVLVLHGAYADGRKIMRYTQMNAFAEKKGFIVLYPDKDGWMDWALDEGNHSHDIAFIRALLADVKRTYPVDGRRIYATGYSSGGELDEILACTMADELAAIAPVASNMRHRYADTCQSNRPVPVLMINGTADRLDPWHGDGNDLMSIPDSIAFWKQHNGCRGESVVSQPASHSVNDPTRIQVAESTHCAQQSTVSLVKIDGGGHTWPGSMIHPTIPPAPFAQLILGRTTHNMDANEMIWNFFSAHPLRGQTDTMAQESNSK
jgi:polyhydroxybutyrate depolymerase